MECKHVQEILADYLGDELNSSCRVAFESHLAICPQCRREAESLQTTMRCLEQLAVPPVTMADSSDTLLSGRKRRIAVLRRYVLRPLAYAATLAIGVGIGWFGKTLLSDSGKVFEPPLPKTGYYFFSEIPKGQVPNQLVRNAVALSAAFSQPFGG
jgi:anti-sigma factor RsiW